VEIDLCARAEELLAELAREGLWGSTPRECAERLVDEGLRQFVGRPRLSVPDDDDTARWGKRGLTEARRAV